MNKVFLIEDDPTMRSLLKTLLEIEGFEVSTFRWDGDLLEALKKDSPDLILLDVHLRDGGGTEVNGFDMLSRIRSDESVSHIKIIMSSGLDFAEEAHRKGANGFIAKPYMPDVLISLIKKSIESE
jgi:two-component system alkaline phosphatase synthesis response regulator PhoP